MSNQSEDGWFPECDNCGCGNLGKIVTLCEDCFNKMTYDTKGDTK